MILGFQINSLTCMELSTQTGQILKEKKYTNKLEIVYLSKQAV